MSSDQLNAMLQELEAKVNKADPQQALLLQQAQTHTRALQQARGDWERRSTSRSWNADALPEKDTPPLELPSYREYAALMKDDTRRCHGQDLLAQDSSCKLLHGARPEQAQEAKRPTGDATQSARV